MLEGVNVDVAFAQRFVRQHVVVEGHQLNVKAILLFCHFLRDFSNLLFRTDDHADFNMVRDLFFILTATHQSQRTD